MQENKNRPLLKYRLLELIKENMTIKQKEAFFANLQVETGIPTSTFYRWSCIPYESDQVIKSENLARLAQYLGAEAADLQNFEIVPKTETI